MIQMVRMRRHPAAPVAGTFGDHSARTSITYGILACFAALALVLSVAFLRSPPDTMPTQKPSVERGA